MSEQQPGQGGPKLNKKGCAIFVICVVLFITGSFLIDLAGGFPMVVNWFFTHGDKELTIEEILKGTEPTAAREYTFAEPSAETKKRTIDCKKIGVLSDLKPENPLCLNLYKTSIEEIDKEINTGKYDRIIVYGQSLILDAPSKWEADEVPGKDKPANTVVNRKELASQIYQSAKFNDQVAMPNLLELYGIKSLDSFSALLGNDLPYPAIYSRVSTFQDRKVLCSGSAGSESAPQGCAKGGWVSVVGSPGPISNPMSMPRQRVHRQGREDFLYFDQNAPANCLADNGFMHEAAHNLFSLSMSAGQHQLAVADLHYFNEHQAGLVGDMYSEIACGEGNATNFHTNKDVAFPSIVAYNSIYPAGEMSSAHPKDNKCQLAALTEWNKILSSGKWDEKFAGFYSTMRDKTKTENAFRDGKGFIRFISNASNDPKAKEFLNSYGCGL